MYTILWTSADDDHWERCNSREEVANILTLNNLTDDEDVLIFGPDADDYTLTQQDVFDEIQS